MEQLERTMKEYELDMLALNEARIGGTAQTLTEVGNTILIFGK